MATAVVSTLDAEMEFSIRASTTGKMLFEQVVKTLNLREVWYFGLYYIDTKDVPSWLKMDKKISNQDVPKPYRFKFRPKFYPEDVTEIIQDNTVRHFYLYVRELILSDEIYCPAETAVLLASYAMQVKYEDYDEEVHKPGFLSGDRLLPQRVITQYKLDVDEWEKRIMVWWSDHKEMTPDTAMEEYLKIAQDLEMYGVNYFEIKNKKGTELFLGVDALGLNIYDRNDKLNPRVGFPWSEIRNISFSSKRFTIKPCDKKANDFVFFAPRLRINKRILTLCMGNHELFMRRRRPDTMEVQQMKIQAKEERAQRRTEQERLNKEMSAREAAEKKQREYEERIKQMSLEMERAHDELEAAQATIRQLNQQLTELHEAKSELAQREQDLQALTLQLQSERQMSEEERARLIGEISLREQEVTEMRSQVSLKSSEADRLQREVEANRSRNEEKNNYFHTQEPPADDESNLEVELSSDDDPLVVPDEDAERMTAMEGNALIKKKLEMLTKDLDKVKDESAFTQNDHLHLKNKKAGRDKYKTLRQIRGGNTKRRIDQYENM